MNVRIESISVRLAAPFVSALETVEHRELLLLRLQDDEGHVGWGEAAPLPGYDNVSVEEVAAELAACREVLEHSDGTHSGRLLAQCRRLARLPQTLAAIDLALWDLAGRRARAPVWQLLGADEAPELSVNATIAASAEDDAATAAAAARAAGFGCVKVKVGTGEDRQRLAAVREAAGAAVAIRIDANGAWSAAEAVASLRAYEPLGIELCEEPASGLAAIARVASATHVPLALDESTTLPEALDRRVCDAVCLKISTCGGITGLVHAARRARSAGYGVYLGSTFDGPLGIAAALHAAAVIRPDRPCGLATLGLFGEDEDPLPPRDGLVAMPPGAGLGSGLTGWYGQA